jgi:hypothetical protein
LLSSRGFSPPTRPELHRKKANVRTGSALSWGFPQVPLWIGLLLFAQGLDVMTTAVGLRLGIPEGNPLMISLFRLHGELAMYVLKLVTAAAVVWAIARLRYRYRRVWPIALAMVVPTLVAVVNNVVLIADAHG